MQTIFVAGAGTDIGKTYVACALIRGLRGKGRTVDALKPVLSGFDPDDPSSADTARLLDALGRAVTTFAIEAMSPLRFKAALAPDQAARREGRTLYLAELTTICRRRMDVPDADFLLIEGAGGVMSPLAEDGTNLDLIQSLGVPVVLVTGSYLGAINHGLTALETLKARGVPILALAVSESLDGVDLDETVRAMERFCGGTPVVPVRRGGEANALADLLLSPSRSGRSG